MNGIQASDREYRRIVNAWAMYDWANSAFALVIVTAVFPVYYRSLVINAGGAPEDATAYWAYTNSLSILVVAVAGPLLGAIADLLGARKRFLAVALAIGALGSASLTVLGAETYLVASLLFAVANLGFAGGNIFYESLLPAIARPDDLDRVSARGYALGYLGSALLLVVNVLWLSWPERFGLPDRDFALRLTFVSVALWWVGFAIPLFLKVKEPGGNRDFSQSLLGAGLNRLSQSLTQIRQYRQLALFLLAFWLYNDGISTIIKLAAAYGDEIGLDHNQILLALILTQLIGFPCSIGFGALAGRLGAKRSVLLGITVYTLISLGGFFIRTTADFFLLAAMVGVVQGGTQALSRSLFASMVPKTRSTEFFAFFSTGEKMAGIIGPAIFGLIGQLSGSSRWGIVSLIVLFIAGGVLLRRVDAAEGQRIAKSVDASTESAKEFRAPSSSGAK